MRLACRILLSMVLLVLALTPGLAADRPAAADRPLADPPALPLFVENVGQFPEQVRFQMWGSSWSTWLTDDGLWLTISDCDLTSHAQGVVDHASDQTGHCSTTVVQVLLEGRQSDSALVPEHPASPAISYLRGNDPAGWQQEVPVWHSVRYANLYPGMDLVIGHSDAESAFDSLPWRWDVQPEADLSRARLRVVGASRLEAADGALYLRCGRRDLLLGLPHLEHTERPAKSPSVETLADGVAELTWPFRVQDASPERSASSMDDPTSLLLGTYLGGSDRDMAWGLARDGSGNLYVTGETASTNFPSKPGSYDVSPNGDTDCFVLKLNPAGSTLLYATFVGGGDFDTGTTVAVDGAQMAYVVGDTKSANFPTTPGAMDTTLGGTDDVILFKLSATGSQLIYSTYFGGSNWDISVMGPGLALLPTGSVRFAGWTTSADFPKTPGCFDPNFSGWQDAFVAELNPSGSALTFATYLGGDQDDIPEALAVDSAGNTYVTGRTESANFPTSPGAFDRQHNGGPDVFVTKLNPAGSSLIYSTFLGGGDWDIGLSVAVDGTGQAYVAGQTRSGDFPATVGAYDAQHGGDYDAFLAKLNPAGSACLFATYLGGGGFEDAQAVALDGWGNLYLAGHTGSERFPVTAEAFDSTYNRREDSYVVVLDGTGSFLRYGTFLGGSEHEQSERMLLSGTNEVWVLGQTWSCNFPTTAGAFDRGCNGQSDGFLVKLSVNLAQLPTPTSSPTATRTATATRTSTSTPTRTRMPTPTGWTPRHWVYLPICRKG